MSTLLMLLTVVSAVPTDSKRYDGDKHKGNKYIDTLSWAVIISPQSTGADATIISSLSQFFQLDTDGSLSDTVSNTVADTTAKELGLVNRGLISKLPNHFLFEHPYHEQTINVIKQLHRSQEDRTEFTIPEYPELKKHLHTDHGISDLHWQEIEKDIEQKLEEHPQVSWFARQSFRPRQKRSEVKPVKLKFEDPFYRKQWHLVRDQFHAS